LIAWFILPSLLWWTTPFSFILLMGHDASEFSVANMNWKRMAIESDDLESYKLFVLML